MMILISKIDCSAVDNDQNNTITQMRKIIDILKIWGSVISNYLTNFGYVIDMIIDM